MNMEVIRLYLTMFLSYLSSLGDRFHIRSMMMVPEACGKKYYMSEDKRAIL